MVRDLRHGSPLRFASLRFANHLPTRGGGKRVSLSSQERRRNLQCQRAVHGSSNAKYADARTRQLKLTRSARRRRSTVMTPGNPVRAEQGFQSLFAAKRSCFARNSTDICTCHGLQPAGSAGVPPARKKIPQPTSRGNSFCVPRLTVQQPGRVGCGRCGPDG